MPNDMFSVIVHNSYAFSDAERKKVGEFGGIEFIADPNLPEDELRIVKDGKIVERFKLPLA